ncbi:hypothetical protein ABW636_12810 [Aquimarina sp. 2201CG1-2-11]|uniref:hypothetical protein n=1 Tax=Aquimarina discodermiae TaxID=3231043 RepID=UPI0034628A50
MKNRLIVFMSTLMATTLLLSCSNDDNDTSNPADSQSSNDIVAEDKYQDVKSATREINAVVKNAMPNPSSAGRIAKNLSNDECFTITSEETDTEEVTNIIDYGDECTSPNGKPISGKILISAKIKQDSEDLTFDITYTLENFSFNGITVSGSAVATFSFGNFTTGEGQRFVTNSDYVFTWDDGLKVTSTDKTTIENVNGQEDTYYSLVTMNSESNFSTGEVLISKTTSPLKLESECEYVVSGVIVTSENGTTSNTLDYGDGTCDKIATQTDGDGNTTTIDLDEQLEENFSV